MNHCKDTAKFLLDRRLDQTLVDNIPENLYPRSVVEAYETQDELVSQLTEKHNSETCGYKLACTNKLAMDLLNVDGPFSGKMMTHSIFSNGVVLDSKDFVRRVVELEFNFVLGEDVAETSVPYTAETIKPYIKSFLPGIEIVDHRYTDFTNVGGNALIADNAIHGACIHGEASGDWQATDLSQHGVQLVVNNEVVSRGSGEAVLGHPLNVMAWLQNHLQSRGRGLKSGEIVTTGTACDVYNAEAGDKIRADFGKLGSVSLEFK